jgi:tripartite-type tricarboxylate transporter receptor subunit TctC
LPSGSPISSAVRSSSRTGRERPGTFGLESVIRAAPDGYTLSLCGSTELRNEILYNDLKFSFMHDTTPVASLMLAMNVLVVHPEFSVHSVPELIAAAKANPDAITVASSGLGSTPHVFWELFRSMTGASMLHVPYRGGAPALTDVLGRQVQVYFATIADAMEHIKAGRLRALAVTGATRTQALPDVPTIGEFVAGYEAIGWLGVVDPKDAPAAIVGTLNATINAGLADAKIKQTITDWVKPCLRVRPRSLQRSSRLKTRNGARSSERRTSSFSASKPQTRLRLQRFSAMDFSSGAMRAMSLRI